MSEKLLTVVPKSHYTPLKIDMETKLGMTWRLVEKSPAKDINDILLYFAPYDLQDVRLPTIKDYLKWMVTNARLQIAINIEDMLSVERDEMCYGAPNVSEAVRYDRIVDILLRIARNTGQTTSSKLPLAVLRVEIGFISFTENLAAIFLQMRKTTGHVTSQAYANLFKSLTEMHQLRLWEGSIFETTRMICGQMVRSSPHFVCAKKNRPAVIIKVFNNKRITNNNNDGEDSCVKTEPWVKKEADSERDYSQPEIRLCCSCGRSATCCSDIGHMLSQYSNPRHHEIDPFVEAEVTRDMLVTLCRDDILPFFNNPPRILSIIVEETRIRFAKLIMDEDDIVRIREGGLPRDPIEITYTKPYNMLNTKDRIHITGALLRVADILG